MRLLNERNFKDEMETYVEPCFLAWGRESWYTRERGKNIFCLSLHRKKPKGVILISHGFCENGEKYKELAWYFYQAGFTVYIPEHCGHGRSYRLTKDPYKVHIDDFRRYVKDLSFIASRAAGENPGIPMFLYGHSMGGAIGAVTLAENPGRFQKGILNAPMILHRTGIFRLFWFMGLLFWPVLWEKERAMLRDSMASGMMKLLKKVPVFPEPDLTIIMKRGEKPPAFQNNGASCRWGLEAYRMSREISSHSRKKISVPVLLFQAEKETLVYAGPQERLIRQLPDGRLIRVPGAKHEIYRSGNDILKPYLNKVLNFYLN